MSPSPSSSTLHGVSSNYFLTHNFIPTSAARSAWGWMVPPWGPGGQCPPHRLVHWGRWNQSCTEPVWCGSCWTRGHTRTPPGCRGRLSCRTWSSKIWQGDHKVCVFDLVHVFRDDLSLHFINRSEINSEDSTKWGHLNKNKDTYFIRLT